MNLCSCDTKPAESCGCERTLPSPGPGLPLAIATVPLQPWETPFEACRGLQQGTIFPSLVLPFFAKGGTAHD